MGNLVDICLRLVDFDGDVNTSTSQKWWYLED